MAHNKIVDIFHIVCTHTFHYYDMAADTSFSYNALALYHYFSKLLTSIKLGNCHTQVSDSDKVSFGQ